MAWFRKRKPASPTSRELTEGAEPRPIVDPSESTDQRAFAGRYFFVVEAIAWWRAKLPDGQVVLADAATRALLAGADGAALAELGGCRELRTHSSWTLSRIALQLSSAFTKLSEDRLKRSPCAECVVRSLLIRCQGEN